MSHLFIGQAFVHRSIPVCSPEADVVFQSNDGVNFLIHKINLQTSADGFPPAEFATKGETVQLTETAATLELLFRFVYPQELPDLENEEFETIYSLAEAAEKYRVYAAIALCKVFLKCVLLDVSFFVC